MPQNSGTLSTRHINALLVEQDSGLEFQDAAAQDTTVWQPSCRLVYATVAHGEMSDFHAAWPHVRVPSSHFVPACPYTSAAERQHNASCQWVQSCHSQVQAGSAAANHYALLCL